MEERWFLKPNDDRVCLSDFTKELADMFAGLGQYILDASRNITEAMDDLGYTISREK